MENEKYELKLPNGVGEQVLARTIGNFDVELKQTEMGPKLLGSREELEKALDFIKKSIEERLNELEGN